MRTLALAVLALSAFASSAQAQYSFNLNPISGVGTTGLWQAQLDTVDNLTWNLKIFGGGTTPNDDAFQVAMGFTGMPVNGPNTGTGGINSPSFNNWVKGASDTNGFVAFSTGLNPTNDLLKTSTTSTGYFQSTFTLASAPSQVLVDLYGRNFPGVGWSNSLDIAPIALTPELPGAAQLIPALLPLGLVLRRRRKS